MQRPTNYPNGGVEQLWLATRRNQCPLVSAVTPFFIRGRLVRDVSVREIGQVGSHRVYIVMTVCFNIISLELVSGR